MQGLILKGLREYISLPSWLPSVTLIIFCNIRQWLPSSRTGVFFKKKCLEIHAFIINFAVIKGLSGLGKNVLADRLARD